MKISSLIKNKPYLFWDVKNPEKLSEKSLLEHILNYGDFSDAQDTIKYLGIKKAANIFTAQLKSKRHNYRPKIANYFQLYFKKHA